jgi:gamma-glutamylcyclotransferase (GGCT)/AIG2-like uncharacterized protein YtfP
VDYPLFVYGTLRSGSESEFARRLHDSSEFVSTGRVRGCLYRIATYPGCVEEECVENSDGSNDSNTWVTGEIWRPRENRTLLETLDRYEGPEYRRVVRTVETPEAPVDCWVYLYIASIDGKQRIISGDWLAELQVP